MEYYTIQRITKKNKFVGKEHITLDVENTLCGKEIKPCFKNWFIITNDGTGQPDCKECLIELNKIKE